MKLRKGRKKSLIFGVGINDVDYSIETKEFYYDSWGKKRSRVVWSCPFYRRWRDMLRRCYDISYQERQPTYVNCEVVDEWKTLSNFKAWMETQDWEGKQLDKDLLVRGNKVYGPETCVFVDQLVNLFLIDDLTNQKEQPVGVSWYKPLSKYRVQCRNPFTGKQEYLGYFTDQSKAHQIWKERKYYFACQLADLQTDERVAVAIKSYYSGYGEHVNEIT